MTKAVVGISKSRDVIETVIEDLQTTAGIAVPNISVMVPDSNGAGDFGAVKATKAPEGATTGGVVGGLTGGVLGLLAGIGTLAIPGLGPFIAAGPIMAALGGAAAGGAAGGIVGALVGLGIPEYEAKTYEDRLKGGSYLIGVHVDDNKQARIVRDVYKRHGLEDISTVADD